MMFSRIPLTLVTACAVFVSLALVQRADAIDRYWTGNVSNVYGGSTGLGANAGNWNSLSGTGTSPRASLNERAVIGTDNPSGALNSDDAPNGSPMLAGGALVPGGIALGIRQFDYNDDCEGNYCNPTPNAGELVGRLTFNPGASLTLDSTGDAAFGADGRLLVGDPDSGLGRGYFTMTGGSMTARALIVSGENITTNAGTVDELGPSLVDLSGSSILNVTNPVDQTTAITDFGRRLRVEGPDVDFTSQGRLRLLGTNTYTAVITSATAHSPLNAGGVAFVGGNLFVEFSGAGATHSVGQTWDLVDAAIAVSGSFSNLGVGGNVQVSGFASPPPVGSAYRLKKVPGPAGHTLLQLSLERLLVLEVNRITGEISITNPHDGPISIDSYTVSSPLGSLVDTYHGISGTLPTPPSPNWVKPNPSANALTELINDPDNDDTVFNLSGVATVPLGVGFAREAVADDVNNFGTDGEDLVFQYSAPGAGIIRGQVQYVGTKFENNLVLRVDPDTGMAFLKNDSLETLTFDGFSILSSTGDLDGAGFTAVPGGTGTWDISPSDPNALSQVNFTGSRTLEPTDPEIPIGDISATGFTSQEAQDGLSMQFILAESLVPQEAFGDYNDNGVVDAADYTLYRDNVGAEITLPNENPDAMTPGLVDQEDYDFWVQQFGTVAGPAAEQTFRLGSVVFDDMAGAGAGSLAGGTAVPEPSTGLLTIAGLAAALALPRRIRDRATRSMLAQGATIRRTNGERGVGAMSRRFGICLLAVVAVGAVIFTARPAAAVTGGITITNFDMELPGPEGTKVVAFETTAPYVPNGAIDGWTFTGGMGGIGEIAGEGAEDFGDGVPGDSGTEGGGNPGNEMLLSTNDGRAYQVAPGSSIVNPPENQTYKLGFDARDIFTIDSDDNGVAGGFELTARFFYGAYPGTTLTTLAVNPDGNSTHFEVLIGHDDPILMSNPGAVGQTLGVEFDTTSREYAMSQDPVLDVAKSWAGIDNVVFEIAGTAPGDLNGDGAVDGADAAILVANMQRYTPFEAEGELTGDNTVNLNDFRVLKNLMSAGAGAGAGSGGVVGGQGVPEPSTWVLVLLAVLAVSCVRARMKLSALQRLACLVTVVVVALLAISLPVRAAVLVYEPFDIPSYVEGPLVGQTPPSSFFTGNWVAGSGGTATAEVVVPTSLSYLGAPSQGGSVTASAETRVGIHLAVPLGTGIYQDGTYYLSYLANYGAVDDPQTDAGTMGFRTTEFYPENTPIGEARDGEVGFQGYGGEGAPPSQARLRWLPGGGGGGQQFLTDLVFNEFGGTHLIVLKFVFSSTETDSISVFLDPVSAVEPEVPTASASGLNFTLGAMTTISKFWGAVPADPPVFDELRVATTFLEALPALPLPGDTDGDDDVDLDDYNNIVTYMNLSGSAVPNTPELHPDVARADGMQGSDGRVTIADYRLWRDNYDPPSEGAGALSPDGVPEPSTLALVLAAAAGLTGGVRRAGRSTHKPNNHK